MACSAELGLKWEEALFDSTDAIYQKYYNVTRTEISTIPIKFANIPELLADRKIAA
jgi:hypothetical protein